MRSHPNAARRSVFPWCRRQAYINYYTTTNDYNRAQFRLFRALGYPAQGLACGDSFGAVLPVDTSRPPQMAPVHAPAPCSDCAH